MPCPPYCMIYLERSGTEDSYRLAPKYYEYLKNRLDENETGWVELELYEHPSGRALVRLEDIKQVIDAPQVWLDAADDLADQQRKENLSRGLG